MSALRVVLSILNDDASITAPVYPIVAPETADVPFIVATTIFEDQELILAGATDAFQARVSVACHAATPAAVDRLGEAVKAALENTINVELTDGASPPVAWAGATIWKAGNDMHDYSDDRTVYRRVIDWTVRWWRLP